MHQIPAPGISLDDLVGLAQILGALATAGALWVTWLTLRELKHQTELANDPRLRIRFRIIPSLAPASLPAEGPILPELLKNAHDSWLGAITKNVDRDLSGLKDAFLCIELANSGKSEITQLRCEVNLTVNMLQGAKEAMGYPIGPTDYSEHVDLSPDLSEKQRVYLPIANTRYFPVFTLTLSGISYSDVRGIVYTDFDGPHVHGPISNSVLSPASHLAAPPSPAAEI